MVAMATEFRTGEERRRREKEEEEEDSGVGEGGRQEGSPARCAPRHHPAPQEHHPITQPPLPHPARKRKGEEEAGSWQGCHAALAGGAVPEHPKSSRGRPSPPESSRAGAVTHTERVFTRHHPDTSICFDPRAKYCRPRRKNRNHLGRP